MRKAFLAGWVMGALGFCGPLCAQQFITTRYADDSGLPSRMVWSVTQDQGGFIWVAGNNGLFKFDGQKFTPYMARLKDTVGLRDNKITALLQSTDERLWVGTPKGLHVLQNDTISYIKLIDNPSDEQQYILDVFEDKDNDLWVATYGGLFLVEPSLNVIRFLSEADNTVSQGVVWSVNQDLQGRIWVAGKDGPYLLEDKQAFTFKKLSLQARGSDSLKKVNYFEYLPYNDSIYLATSNNGILKAKLSNDTIFSIDTFLDAQGKELPPFFIENAMIDREGYVWITTAKQGFKKFQFSTGRLLEEEVVSKNGFLNISGASKDIYEDRQGNFWISNTNGLYKLSEDRSAINTFPPRYLNDCLNDFYGIYAMTEDKGGHLWITTPSQLYRLKKSDILEEKCPEDYLLIEDENMHFARHLYIDDQNRLWIGADGGLFITQLDTNYEPGKFIRLGQEQGFPHNWSYDIHQVAKHTFWVGNYAGLVKISFPKGDLTQPSIKVFESSKERSDALVNAQSMELEQDVDGNLWVGTFSGLSRLLKESEGGSFQNYSSSYGGFSGLSNNAIKKVYRDREDRLWIATQRGLNLYEGSKDQFRQFGYAEGLPSEYVLGIQQDSEGFLWIGTTNGVIKTIYDGNTKALTQIEHFTYQDGLADNIPYRNSILIDEDDRVFIGSREGISVLRSSGRVAEVADFGLVITDIKTSQKKDPGFKSVLKKIEDKTLLLKHFENSLTVNYAALDFLDPKYNRYRHKLLPVDEEWVNTGNTSELSFYNLSPGDYELVLEGANSVGVWSDNPIRLQIKIAPPFWRSNWAFLLYLLTTAIILRFFYVLRVRKKVQEVRQQAMLEQALVEEREQLRQENAADFHDELGSKVTKISLYLTLAERSLQNDEDPLPWFSKIRDHIKGLSGSFRDLLWVIDPQKDSLSDTLLRLKDFGEELFQDGEVNFRTHGLDLSQNGVSLDPQTRKQLVMIFKEAMTNSLKYSNSNEVDLILESNTSDSTITLVDNGSGFDLSSKSKGRGLLNMKNRANKIAAELTIESSVAGTRVRLSRIPHMRDKIH